MKRRDFIKHATAVVALSAMPVSLAALIKPSDIKWSVDIDPSYFNNYRIIGSTEINSVPFMSQIIVEADQDGGITKAKIDSVKGLIMNHINWERRR